MFQPRWKATVHYRADAGLVDVVHDMEEIGEIQQLAEAGPHWDTIDRVEIVIARHATDPNLTVEASREL